MSHIEGEQDVGFMVLRHHMVLDEDHASIGTFGNEAEESNCILAITVTLMRGMIIMVQITP